MNTPSNAGKEHNPWDRKPHEYGAPEWRLLNTDEAVQIGDEYNYKDYRCEPRWAAVEHAGYLPISHTEYRRRTTPPTQEGTDIDSQISECAAEQFVGTFCAPAQLCRDLSAKLTAAQRENDRLRSEVAGLKADRERLDWLIKQGPPGAKEECRMCLSEDVWDVAIGFADDPESLDVIAVRAAIDTARAATEEGKRG